MPPWWQVLLEPGEPHAELRVVPGSTGDAPSLSASEHCTVVLGGELDPAGFRETEPGIDQP